MAEIRTQFLMTVVDDNRRMVNLGAGVDDRDRVVLIFPGCEPLPLAIVKGAEFLALVREAIQEAARGQRD